MVRRVRGALGFKELVDYLDKQLRAKEVPTYYQIEDQYRGNGRWGRGELIAACRYMWFHQSKFDDELWKRLMENHPLEAKFITNEYNRTDDVHFG